MRFNRYYPSVMSGRPTRLTKHYIQCVLMGCLAVASPTLWATHIQEPDACVPDTIAHPGRSLLSQGDVASMPIELEADQIDAPNADIVILTGNAELKQGPQSLFADRLEYDKQTDSVTASGNVIVHTPNGDRFETTELGIEMATQIGETGPAQYRVAERKRSLRDAGDFYLTDSGKVDEPYSDRFEFERSRPPIGEDEVYVGGRGAAEKIFMEGEGFLRLENADFSRCREGKDDVVVRARNLVLDNEAGIGIARHATIRFKNLPIFYTPYMSFPISSERKTGFLAPGIGHQNDSGTILNVPYYWNIAPNVDATITPRLYSDRGVQLGGEFRYLGDNSEGILRGQYLPGDDAFADEDRYAVGYDHDHRFTPRWQGVVELQEVSDDLYFDNFSNDLNVSSSTHLPQRAEARYSGAVWKFAGSVVGYQTIDATIPDASRPYDRLPRFTLDARSPRSSGLFRYELDSEFVNFDRDDRIRGWRLGARPSVSLPIERVYGILEPKLGVQYIGYSLEDQPAGDPDDPSVTAPIFTLNGEIFFERDSNWAGRPHVHTLEPRAFYVYSPEENQDDLPDFDTSEINFNNFSNIFREDRFFGGDRIGDTNQITLGLTSRLFEVDSGVERLKASLGQIFFFDDREVNLDPTVVDTEDKSDFLADLQAQLTDHFELNGFVQWDQETSETEVVRADLGYRPSPSRRLGVAYRFDRDSTEQVDLYADWPLSPRWQFRFVERYSLETSENLETIIGLGFDGCCWKLNVSAQRRVDRTTGFRDALFVVLELNGLGRIRAGL